MINSFLYCCKCLGLLSIQWKSLGSYIASTPLTLIVWTKTFFQVSSFVFYRRKQFMQNFNFQKNFPF